jgi:hypothetical protein
LSGKLGCFIQDMMIYLICEYTHRIAPVSPS